MRPYSTLLTAINYCILSKPMRFYFALNIFGVQVIFRHIIYKHWNSTCPFYLWNDWAYITGLTTNSFLPAAQRLGLIEVWIGVVVFPKTIVFWKHHFYLESKLLTPRWGNSFLFRSFQKLPGLHVKLLKGFVNWHHCTLQGPSTHLLRCFWN